MVQAGDYAAFIFQPLPIRHLNGIALALSAPTDTDAERIFNALAEGGKVNMPLTGTFFSSKFGMLADKFGIGWMVLVAHD